MTSSVQRARARWRAARSFDELCELGARFVEGELSFFPGWNAPELDEESDEIAPSLARLCRAGFLTVASQPARAEQRAFVSGFATTRLARALQGAATPDGIAVAVWGVDAVGESASSPAREPVSLHAGVAHAFAGHDARAEEIVCFEDHVTPAVLDELRTCAWISAWDREWGRPERLWSALERALALHR